jgi:hypothetical protein
MGTTKRASHPHDQLKGRLARVGAATTEYIIVVALILGIALLLLWQKLVPAIMNTMAEAGLVEERQDEASAAKKKNKGNKETDGSDPDESDKKLTPANGISYGPGGFNNQRSSSPFSH